MSDLAAGVRRALDTLTDASFGRADVAAMHEDSLNGYADLAALEARDADVRHWTRRMLQALDGYWVHCDGLPRAKWATVRSLSTAEDWWNRFEKYRARVEALL